MRLYFFILFGFLFFEVDAQNKPVTPASQSALVEVGVTDEQKRPRKGELILLESFSTKKRFTGRTDAQGKAIVKVPIGDEYAVTLKALADSNQYGRLNIPALKAGESYTGNFLVEIMYEPKKTFTLDNVHFDIGKATLRTTSFKALNELAEYLKWKEDQKIEIAGHTDNTGTNEDNLVLSHKRAEAVRNYLLKKGISPTLVIAKGYGATEPVADNNSSEGKQQNRRTEVRLIDATKL